MGRYHRLESTGDLEGLDLGASVAPEASPTEPEPEPNKNEPTSKEEAQPKQGAIEANSRISVIVNGEPSHTGFDLTRLKSEFNMATGNPTGNQKSGFVDIISPES